MLVKVRHPDYNANIANWTLWRNAYSGGDAFINRYLKQFSRRETSEDFALRKEMTYNAAFSKSAVRKVKNAIFQRTADVTRMGGTESYQRAIKGLDGGVDLAGSTMSGFIGRFLLDELLTMRKVGVYVDMPEITGPTLLDKGNKHPYLYKYCVEDICSWDFEYGDNDFEFTKLLLRDHVMEYDEESGLISGEKVQYRHLWLDANHDVQFAIYDEDTKDPKLVGQLGISKIPFVLMDIGVSLMEDIAKYQVALLNMGSSDVNFCVKGNFPIYTEQFDARSEMAQRGMTATTVAEDGTITSNPMTKDMNEIIVGAAGGRRYPIGAERPDFIFPSAEPLNASMDKQERMKQEILFLVDLALSSIQPSAMASAESKNIDERSLENGLSAIGLELEHGEQQISLIWAMYDGQKVQPTITYPVDWSSKSDQENRQEVEHLKEILTVAPSRTYQKEIAKKIARVTLGNEVKVETLKKIESEIDKAPNINSDPESITMDIDNGILDKNLASEIRGYPEGTVDKAKKEFEDALKATAAAQAPKVGPGGDPNARGLPGAGDPKASSKEKAGKPKRGEGKAPE